MTDVNLTDVKTVVEDFPMGDTVPPGLVVAPLTQDQAVGKVGLKNVIEVEVRSALKLLADSIEVKFPNGQFVSVLDILKHIREHKI